MHFVEIGDRAELVGDIADLLDRRDVAIHRIDALEGDELGHFGPEFGQLAVEVFRIVMRPDLVRSTAVPDALDHRGMVKRVGEDHAARNSTSERAETGPVRHVAAGEQQRGLLACLDRADPAGQASPRAA